MRNAPAGSLHMEHFEIYFGVFGLWGWERMDADGAVISESANLFELREDCVEDAWLHGCDVREPLDSAVAA
jgi:hypothetical protein